MLTWSKADGKLITGLTAMSSTAFGNLLERKIIFGSKTT